MVPSLLPQRLWSPLMHWWQTMQLPEYQPSPTVSPTATLLTPSPMAATVPDHLMTGHDGVAGHPPVIVEHGEIGVADTASRDIDLDLARFEFTGLEIESLKAASGLVGGVGTDHG